MAEKTEFKTVETSQEDLEELEEKIRRHRHKIARRTALVIVTGCSSSDFCRTLVCTSHIFRI